MDSKESDTNQDQPQNHQPEGLPESLPAETWSNLDVPPPADQGGNGDDHQPPPNNFPPIAADLPNPLHPDRMKPTDWIVAGATVFIAFVGLFQYFEMDSSGKQTDTLLGLYQQQLAQLTKQVGDTHELALRTKELADRMKDQADRTKTIADQAVIQPPAARSAANTARDALHVSERAYIVTGAPVLELDTNIVDIPVSNTGHIPSGSLRIVVHEATIDVKPTAPPGIIPTTEQHWQHYDVTPIPPSNGATYTIDTPVQGVVASKINSGHQQIFVAGSITYHDGFPDTPEQTWLFCNADRKSTRLNSSHLGI